MFKYCLVNHYAFNLWEDLFWSWKEKTSPIVQFCFKARHVQSNCNYDRREACDLVL